VPEARFVVEESEVYELAGVTEGALEDDEVWIVDPLDGTMSFVHTYPFYSVSVACVREGNPVAGAVYAPRFDELFSAAVDEGAFMGTTRLSCSTVARLEESLLVTGFPYDRGAIFDRQHEILGTLMRLPIHGMRRDGSAALDCTHVAAGRADGFWEFGLQPWDTAAGVVIAAESGALVTGIDGEPWSVESTGVIAANPQLHARLLGVIESVG
jgi:myo-inositol-1(or 4)-monophosphatase